MTPSTAALRVDETQTLSAVVDAINGAGTGVTWSSEAPTVATVSASGVVRAVAVGMATVRATSIADSRVSGTASFTVQAVRAVTIAPTTVSLGTAQTRTLVATVQIDDGQPTTVTWRTSAAAIATVSQAGVVTGVAIGAATITAIATADTTLQSSSTVNVVPVVRAVAVNPATVSMFINGTQQLTPTVTADAGASQALMWRSSNPAVATVSATGQITAVALGTSSITALSTADTTRRAVSNVTVITRPITVVIPDRGLSVNPGTSATLTAIVSADPGVSTAVTWMSSNPAVATINAQGVIAGITTGNVLITATAVADASKRDSVIVTVVQRLATTWTPSRLNGALYEDVISVAALTNSSAFAINVFGDIYRWNGTVWTLTLAGVTYNTAFTAIHAEAANNVLAVGRGGVIARWNGTAWSAMSSGTTRDLFAVYVESATSAWAAGANGTVRRLAGSTWNTESVGSTETLNAIWAGDNVVYVVGANAEVLRRTGSVWGRVAVPSSETLYGVHGVSASNVVAVGTQGTALAWDGTNWTVLGAGGFDGSFFGITGSAANSGRRFLVGDGGVAQLDGSTITLVTTPYTPRTFGVSLTAAGTVWATGQRGAVLRSAAPAWETLNLAPDLLDVWTTSANNAFAVGEFGFVYRWNGSAWTRQPTPTTASLNTVWAVSATDAFAAGEAGTMLRWNGSTWSTMAFPSTSSVYALWGTAANNVYATTRSGEVLRFTGTTWSVVTTSTSALWAVYGSAANDVYATGENGTVQRFNGLTWSPLPSPGSGTLAGLWATGPTTVRTVGADALGTTGVAFGYNGSSWSSLQVGSSRVLTNIWGPSLFDLYATGDEGTLLRFNGNTWSTIPTGTSDLLWSVSGSPDGLGGAFAVGFNATVLAGSHGAAAAMLRGFAPVTPGNLEPSEAARTTDQRWGRRPPPPSGAARQRRRGAR